TREWDEIQQAIGTLSEDEDVGVEATDAGQAFIWLSEYLADRPAHSDLDQAAQGQVPYQLEEGGWFIFGPAFRDWLQRTRNERLTPSRMGEILRAYGCEHSVVNVEVNQKRTTRSVWSVPDYASNGHGVLRGIAPGRGATMPPGAPGSGRGSPQGTPGGGPPFDPPRRPH